MMPPLTTLNPEEKERYARHIVIPEIREEGQSKLKSSRVLAIGSPESLRFCLMYLASAGVGTLGIISEKESPEFSPHEWLHEINPSVHIEIYPFSPEHFSSILKNYDLVIDCSGNHHPSICNASQKLNKPHLFSHASQHSVYISTSFNDRTFGEVAQKLDLSKSPTSPILSNLAGILQATEAIKIILESGNCLTGKVMEIDVSTMTFREMT